MERLDASIEALLSVYGSNSEARNSIAERLVSLITDLSRAKSAMGLDLDHSRSANEIERKRVDARLNGFVYKNSAAWQVITEKYGDNLNQAELLSLAEVIAAQLNLKVDREAKRRKEVLVKWYDEHLPEIMNLLPLIVLEDKEGNKFEGKKH